jgi:hypothetical protein
MPTRMSAWGAIIAVAVLIAATAVVGATAGRGGGEPAATATPAPVACTEEAKLCPDGSAVGRAGPECRFDPCPLEQGAGVVRGKVTIAPLAPVETPGPGTPIPSASYDGRLVVFTGSGGRYTKSVAIEPDGTYATWLWPGTYTVDINHLGVDIAKDLPKEITVAESEEVVLDIEIDTGIR